MARMPARPFHSRHALRPPDPAHRRAALEEFDLRRVEEIIRNGRAIWFALLGTLVFAGVTLASVSDLAFFVTSVDTKLPLLNISVPVTSFFTAGALLIAAFYIYFHHYLEQLWQALGEAPSQIEGRPLADRIYPWIIADAALRFRDRLRGAKGAARASRPRGLNIVGNIAAIVLVWLFGLLIVAWFWWRSMPAHNPLMTGWLGLMLMATFWALCEGASGALAALAGKTPGGRWRYIFVPAIAIVAALTVVRTWIDPWEGEPRSDFVTWPLCAGWTEAPANAGTFCWGRFAVTMDILRPARADLREAEFTEKPRDWVGRAIAQAEFRVRWCRERRGINCANPLSQADSQFPENEEAEFQTVWKKRWTAYLASLPKTDLRGKDLRGAHLLGAGLEGTNLSNARLEGANLSEARLGGANLLKANLAGSSLWGANLEDADLREARMDRVYAPHVRLNRANLLRANLTTSDLRYATLNGADIREASLENADIRYASLEGARLWRASLIRTDFTETNLNHAEFWRANLEGARFSRAQLEHTQLSGARLIGESDQPIDLNGVAIDSSEWVRSALRFVNVNDVDLSKLEAFFSTFGDGSVTLPAGYARPCQWAEHILSDEEFFGRWRGWIEAHNRQADLPLNCHPAAIRASAVSVTP